MKITFNKRTRLLAGFTALATSTGALAACSSQPAAGSVDSGTTARATLTETPITLTLSLDTDLAGDAGAPSDAAAPDGSPADAGASAADGGAPPAATLTITAQDGTNPVITDVWLYTLDSAGNQTPITGFTSTQARKTPRLMLPATIGGKPSGLTPADDGRMNGVMTGTTRGKLVQGAFVATFTGTVVVSLASVPTSPILVLAGVEDQRYAGGAVINPDGTAGTVPAGAVVLETHTARSFAEDVAPILKAQCASCHNPTGPDNAGIYLVAGTRDDLVNGNFALGEQTVDCQEADADSGTALAACIQAITKAQFLVEPGAPAGSDLLQRARPDEDAGTSTLGLAWYGGKGQRYNATYGDRRMPSTTQSTKPGDWTNQPIYFDLKPADFQVLYDWVAQGALP
jgi:hypothetical protein